MGIASTVAPWVSPCLAPSVSLPLSLCLSLSVSSLCLPLAHPWVLLLPPCSDDQRRLPQAHADPAGVGCGRRPVRMRPHATLAAAPLLTWVKRTMMVAVWCGGLGRQPQRGRRNRRPAKAAAGASGAMRSVALPLVEPHPTRTRLAVQEAQRGPRRSQGPAEGARIQSKTAELSEGEPARLQPAVPLRSTATAQPNDELAPWTTRRRPSAC